MNRFLALFSALALSISAAGCCCHQLHGGGACGPPPCGPCGSNYPAYPAYSQAFAQPVYSTAALPGTGFATASTASTATACDCNTGAPMVAPY